MWLEVCSTQLRTLTVRKAPHLQMLQLVYAGNITKGFTALAERNDAMQTKELGWRQQIALLAKQHDVAPCAAHAAHARPPRLAYVDFSGKGSAVEWIGREVIIETMRDTDVRRAKWSMTLTKPVSWKGCALVHPAIGIGHYKSGTSGRLQSSINICRLQDMWETLLGDTRTVDLCALCDGACDDYSEPTWRCALCQLSWHWLCPCRIARQLEGDELLPAGVLAPEFPREFIEAASSNALCRLCAACVLSQE